MNPGVVQRQIRRLRVLLQLPNNVTAHTFRQCFASRLREEGGDLTAIQKLLGHAYPVTTQRYYKPR
ncbi:MAG: tyrosine-type recombinase/integrase [Candidatus Competibacteraceae bacterium]